MTTDTQWADFLRGQDLLWRRLPTTWMEGPFLGDGLLGTSVYMEPNRNAVRFTVQHGESQDHRPEFGSLYGLARLPVGHLTLEPVGPISSVNWRLSLWDGELTGTITTGSGTLALQAFIRDQVLVVAVTPSGSEQVRWVFHPEEAISPRMAFNPPPEGYTGNPAPTTTTTDGINQVLQPLPSPPLGKGRTRGFNFAETERKAWADRRCPGPWPQGCAGGRNIGVWVEYFHWDPGIRAFRYATSATATAPGEVVVRSGSPTAPTSVPGEATRPMAARANGSTPEPHGDTPEIGVRAAVASDPCQGDSRRRPAPHP